jgi:hypothetical protein
MLEVGTAGTKATCRRRRRRRRRRILRRGKGMVVGRVGIEVEWCER